MRGNFLSIRGLFVIATTTFALLLAAGCGDSDDSATGSSSGDTEEITVDTGSLSKAAFIKKVEPICRKATGKFQTQLGKVFEESGNNPRKPTEIPLEFEFYENDFAKIYQTQIDEISALGAPSGDEQEIAAYLEAVQKGIEEAAEDPEAFNTAFLEAQGNFKETPPLTAAYGLRGCS
ncbi:MAG TPA: hypothetical protein VFW48_10395 [Solirubrobacterales bacterium]|nr:hypothetical protein [Solirubrobacterales bacterium]